MSEKNHEPIEPALASTYLGRSEIQATDTDFGSSTEPGARSLVGNAPEKFGKYRIVRTLGEGGMGAVYLARDTELERDVALKLPKIKGSAAAEILDRFRREARTAATLSHPNICPMYDFGEIEGQFFLTMAYIEGEPLSYYTKKAKAIAARQAALLIRKLALALAHAHEKGIIHRDLKPGNVMINKKAEPIVMDFGLARRDSSDDTRLTQTGVFVGTPAYVSPEQITNRKGEVDQRTDIYSLGVMLYEMLAKRLPFEADSAMSMMAQSLTGIAESPIVHREKACPRLSEIAMKAISRDVTQRYQTMRELADDLTDYLKGDTRPRAGLAASDSANSDMKNAETSGAGPANPAATGTGNIAEVFQTAALDVENIDFLNFELKDYGLGDTNAPHSRTVTDPKSGRSGRSSTSSRATSRSLRQSMNTTRGGRNRSSNNRNVLAFAGGFAFILLVAFGIFLTIRTKHGTVRVEIAGNPDDVEISVDGETISLEVAEKGYEIQVGEHSLTVKADGFETETRKFSVIKDEVSLEVVHMRTIKNDNPTESDSASLHVVPKPEPEQITTSDRAFLAMVDPEAEWKWLPPEPLGKPIESVGTDMTIAISQDGLTLVYWTGGNERRGMYWSRRKDLTSDWTEPIPVHADTAGNDQWSFWVNSTGSEFIGMRNDGKGSGNRLWSSKFDVMSNKWLTPERLEISNEIYGQYPYMNPDETELYFQSIDGQCYVCDRELTSNSWKSPKRLRDLSPTLKDVNFESVGVISSDGKAALLFPDPIVVFRAGKGKPWQNPQRVAGFPRMFPPSYSPAAGILVFDYRRSAQPDLGIMRLVPRDANNAPSVPETSQQDSWPADAPPAAIVPFNAEQAKTHQEAWAKYLGVPVEYENSIGMKFRLIPPGQFTMGSTPEEIARLQTQYNTQDWRDLTASHGPKHEVVLTKPFYLGVYEVKQAEYEKIVGINPSEFAASGAKSSLIAGMDTADFPVDSVTWSEAVDFANRLSQSDNHSVAYQLSADGASNAGATGYRLPTEAQFEFACRAGTTTLFWNGDQDSDLVKTDWFGTNSGNRTHRVGELQGNPFGLFDVHGNVGEWNDDWWTPSYLGASTDKPSIDPVGPETPTRLSKICRSGCYMHASSLCRSGFRVRNGHTGKAPIIGFRLALSVDAVKQMQNASVAMQGASNPDPATRSSVAERFSYNSPVSSNSEIDLLRTIDLQDCLLYGEAAFEETSLRIDSTKAESRVEFPIELPQGYLLMMSMKQSSPSGGLVMSIPFGAESCADFILNGQEGSGIELIGNSRYFENETHVAREVSLSDGQPHSIEFVVQEESIIVNLDGRLYTKLNAKPDRVRPNSRPQNRAAFGIKAINTGNFKILQCGVKCISGTATARLPAKLVSEEAKQAAEGVHGPALRKLMELIATDKSPLTTRSAFRSRKQVLLINADNMVNFTPEAMSIVAQLQGPVSLDLFRMNPDPAAMSVVYFEALGKMPNLTELDLWNRHFVDAPRLQALAQSRTLEALVLDGQHMDVDEFNAVCAMTGLLYLRMDSVGMNDERLQLVLGSLLKLRNLTIGGWNPSETVSEKSIQMIEKLTDLRHLRMNSCAGLNDALVPALSRLKSLTYLNIQGTSITESGSKQLQSLVPETEIQWSKL